MIKVNLLPVKRKRRARPIPAFLLSTIAITLGVSLIMAYLVFFFSSRLNQKKEQFTANEKKISELKEKIKAVEDFEKRNKTFRERSDIIEQLSRNKSVPVRILDEVSSLLPTGTWIHAMTVSGDTVSIDGYGFTNTEIVNYVDNIKNSKMFTEVYLLESKSAEVEKVPVYMFKMTFKVKV